MKVSIQETRFINEQQIDINYLQLQLSNRTLIVATRESQIVRIRQWLASNGQNLNITIIGWWNLWAEGYISNTLGLDNERWSRYNSVIFLDPDRAFDQITYRKLIGAVESL